MSLVMKELSNNGIDFAQYISDLQNAKIPILISVASAFLIGFVYLIVLRLCGGPIIYISLVAMNVGGAIGGYLLFEQGKALAADHPYK